MSLDGFINDRTGSVGPLYPNFKALQESESLQSAIRETGAVVMGRHAYETGNGDYTGYEFQVPIFVLTHKAPAQVAKGTNDRLSFTFVADGVESVITQATSAARDRAVTIVGGASTIQQCLKAGLIDELHVDVRSLLLGDGLSFFAGVEIEPTELDLLSVVETSGVIHLKYRVSH